MKHPIFDSYHLMIDARAINPIFNTYDGSFYLLDPSRPSFIYSFGFHVGMDCILRDCPYLLTVNTNFTLKDEWMVIMRALKETNCYQRWMAKNLIPPQLKHTKLSTGNFIIHEAILLCDHSLQNLIHDAIFRQISHILLKRYCNSEPIDYYWETLRKSPLPKP